MGSFYKNTFAVFASLFFLAVFSIIITMHIGIDADILYPFSLAKDLLTLTSVKHWFFPGPLFIVPDILISLPIVAIFKTPALWACAFSVTQLTIFVITIAYFTQSKKTLPFVVRFISCIYLTIITYTIGHMFFHWAWTLTAGKSFVAVNHASIALCTLLIFFLTKPLECYSVSIKKCMSIVSLVFIFCLSDLFFCLYFFCLNIPYLFIYRAALLKNKRWLVLMICVAVAGILGVIVNGLINPGLTMELDPHSLSTMTTVLGNIKNFWHIMRWYGTSLLFVSPLVLLCFAFLTKKNHLMPLLFGTLCISIVCLLLGLFNVDTSTLRYVGIYFPVIAYALFELLPLKSLRLANTFLMSVIAIIVAVLYAQKHLQHYNTAIFSPKYDSVLTCPDYQKNAPNTLLIATYWSAKVLFENADRKASLLQVAPNLVAPYNWIINPAWQHIVKNPKEALISTYQLNPSVIDALLKLSRARSLCGGQLIKTPLDKALFKLAPVLKEFQS